MWRSTTSPSFVICAQKTRKDITKCSVVGRDFLRNEVSQRNSHHIDNPSFPTLVSHEQSFYRRFYDDLPGSLYRNGLLGILREHLSEWVCRSPFINSRRGTTSVGRHRPNQTEPARCACLVTLKPRPIALSWFKRSLIQNSVFLRLNIYIYLYTLDYLYYYCLSFVVTCRRLQLFQLLSFTLVIFSFSLSYLGNVHSFVVWFITVFGTRSSFVHITHPTTLRPSSGRTDQELSS